MSVSPATMDKPLADIMKGVPAAAGFKGMSSAAQTKKTRIICTLGPACWYVTRHAFSMRTSGEL